VELGSDHNLIWCV